MFSVVKGLKKEMPIEALKTSSSWFRRVRDKESKRVRAKRDMKEMEGRRGRRAESASDLT